MTPRQHAFLACALQDACGGPDKCLDLLDATPFKMGRTRMYEARVESAGVTMPIGAVAHLEGLQKWKLYSATLARMVPEPTDAECALSEACEANEAMGIAQRLVRLAQADGIFTEYEKREIEPALQRVERHIAGIRQTMDARSGT